MHMNQDAITGVIQGFFTTSIIDFVIVFVVLIGAIRGLKTGLVAMIGNIIGAIIGIIVAGHFFLGVAGLFSSIPYLSGVTGYVVAFIVIFAIVNGIFSFLFSIVLKALNIISVIPGISLLNKILGAFLGAVYSIFFIAAFFFFISRLNLPPSVISMLNNSYLIGIVNELSGIFHILLPSNFTDLQSYIE